MEVHLDSWSLDDVRRAWMNGAREEVRRAHVTTLSLGAAVEGACWAATVPDARSVVSMWAGTHPSVGLAVRALSYQDELPQSGDHAAPELEVRRCPTRMELAGAAGIEWEYFLDRFRRSLVAALGVPTARACAISAALCEMANNVVDHSGLGAAPTGVVAYELRAPKFGFAVADIGRGVLASLVENSRHAALSTDADALESAVLRKATRRRDGPGTGFADLQRAMSDLGGRLTFRSGRARLTLDGTSPGARQASVSDSPEMSGFQLSVEADPKKSLW